MAGVSLAPSVAASLVEGRDRLGGSSAPGLQGSSQWKSQASPSSPRAPAAQGAASDSGMGLQDQQEGPSARMSHQSLRARPHPYCPCSKNRGALPLPAPGTRRDRHPWTVVPGSESSASPVRAPRISPSACPQDCTCPGQPLPHVPPAPPAVPDPLNPTMPPALWGANPFTIPSFLNSTQYKQEFRFFKKFASYYGFI